MTGPSSGDRPAEETPRDTVHVGHLVHRLAVGRTDCGITVPDGTLVLPEVERMVTCPDCPPLCASCGFRHKGGAEAHHRLATPPAVRTGDDAHEHRWTPWRRAVPHFDSLGNETSVGIAQVSGLPNTAGWSRQCACGAIEAVPTERALSTPPPVSGTATRDDVALWLLRKFPDAYEDDDRSERRDADELLVLGGSQPAEGQRPDNELNVEPSLVLLTVPCGAPAPLVLNGAAYAGCPLSTGHEGPHTLTVQWGANWTGQARGDRG